MTSRGRFPDIEDGLPTLEDYQRTVGEAPVHRGPGRPRKNPLATQETLRRFEAERRRKQRERLHAARAERKKEVDEFVHGVFEAHPEIQALLIGVVNHVFEYAQRDPKSLTDYDARTYATQAVLREIKHRLSREKTIEFLQATHGQTDAEVEAGEAVEAPVTDMAEEPVTSREAALEAAWEAGELPSLDGDDDYEGGL